MYRGGLTRGQIAELVGAAPKTVAYHLRIARACRPRTIWLPRRRPHMWQQPRAWSGCGSSWRWSRKRPLPVPDRGKHRGAQPGGMAATAAGRRAGGYLGRGLP